MFPYTKGKYVLAAPDPTGAAGSRLESKVAGFIRHTTDPALTTGHVQPHVGPADALETDNLTEQLTRSCQFNVFAGNRFSSRLTRGRLVRNGTTCAHQEKGPHPGKCQQASSHDDTSLCFKTEYWHYRNNRRNRFNGTPKSG